MALPGVYFQNPRTLDPFIAAFWENAQTRGVDLPNFPYTYSGFMDSLDNGELFMNLHDSVVKPQIVSAKKKGLTMAITSESQKSQSPVARRCNSRATVAAS